MDDDDQAPSHFQIDSEEKIQAPPDQAGNPSNNLWFVLSPTCYKNRPLFNQNVTLEFCPMCQGRHRVFYCGDCRRSYADLSKYQFGHCQLPAYSNALKMSDHHNCQLMVHS